MKGTPWRLAWGSADVPHAVLDIVRGCNITCRACYNSTPTAFKAVGDVRKELDRLLELRRLDSIVLLGGEVTLHPQLCDIIRVVREKGIHVEMFTNGLLLDDDLAANLARAGADLIFVHIEPGQLRPDLPKGSPPASLRRLIEEKASLISRHGMIAGLSFTAFPDDLDNLMLGIRYAIESPTIEYLLITLCRDMHAVGEIRGTLATGLRGDPGRKSVNPEKHLTMEQVHKLMFDRLGLRPFAFVPSNRDADEFRWLSYLLGCVVRGEGPALCRPILDSGFERLYLKLHRSLSGRASFFQRNRPGRIRMHLLLNALSGGSARSNMRLLLEGTFRPGKLKCLRLVFQSPAELDEDGRVIHCLDCPDATLREGELIPVCLLDQVVS